MTRKQTRVNNLLLLSEKYGRATIAERLGYEDTNYVNQLCRGHGSFGDKTAEKIESAFGLEAGWMDVAHSNQVFGKESTDPESETDRYKLLLKIGRLIEDFSPAELAELDARVELIRSRARGNS